MSLADRQRKHEATHERTVDQQILDALLRIEESLIKYGQAFSKVDEDGNVEFIPLENVMTNITPTPTPLAKALAKKATGARKVDRL